MTRTDLGFWLTVISTACWPVCFWWMHRISARQDTVLEQLREQGRRIERFAKLEHDLIKEVHPQVGEIKDGMDAMIAAVKENTDATTAEVKTRSR